MNDLRATAERLREDKYGHDPSGLSQWQRDLHDVACAYLAEHHADDDDLVTLLWLLSIPGAEQWDDDGVLFRIPRCSGTRLTFTFSEDGGYTIEVGFECIYDGQPQLRGEVRLLLKALGVGE